MAKKVDSINPGGNNQNPEEPIIETPVVNDTEESEASTENQLNEAKKEKKENKHILGFIVQKDKTKTKDERFKELKNHHVRTEFLIVLGVVLFILIGSVVGGAYAEQQIYKDKVFPGVFAWGMPVGGKTKNDVQKLVLDKLKNYKVELVGPDQTYAATAQDLNLIVDPTTIAQSAFDTGRNGSFFDNYYIRTRLLLSQIKWESFKKFIAADALTVTPNYQVDETTVTTFVKKIADNININPQDSKVTTNGGNVSLVPAVYGRTVDQYQLKKDLVANIKDFDAKKVQIVTTQVKPNIVDKDAETVRIQTENVISRPIILTYQGQTYQPDKATVASWVSYTKATGATSYTLVIDPTKMSNYFAFLKSKIDVPSVTKQIRVENGVTETTTQEGKDGLLVDTTLLGKEISQQLPVQPQVNLEVPTYVDHYKTAYQQVVVANWDKYIDVNISTQTMTAYLKGGQVVGSWLITTGRDGLSTPVGTSLIYSKIYVTSMPNPPSPYPLNNIHYVSYFRSGGYAIHEAWWRSTFGGQDYHWNGSHGCVNASIDVAHFIYDWAPIGTPVTVHY